ncbi:glycosyltransferase [Spirochaeta africana]|uniref:Glycosyltransferase n=1 Tax=Spirochaeta africana (strain ATCC 700263 / DSM 8902 / Z-7692) TaxID=889378 RepID=H9UFA8_SPIAZ|nr:glycosyltransferase [Spirochaeta africana]AFG36201.1 glycosyltransferase [Spirochaeta africana DSM 8902]
MTIAVFSDTYLPSHNGVVTSLRQQCADLTAAGVRVVLVVPAAPGSDSGWPAAAVISVPSVRLSRDGQIRLGLPLPGRLLRKLRGFGITAVHTHTEFSLGLLGRWAASRLSVPWLHTCHTDWDSYRHYLPWLGRHLPIGMLQHRFLKPARCCLVPSAKAAQLVSRRYPTERIRVIPNRIAGYPGHPAPRQQLCSRYGIPVDARIILYAGRIAPEKRVLQLCRALAPHLQAEDGPWLVFAGGGPQLPQLRAEIRRRGIGSRTVCTGWQPHEVMLDWYRTARVFCTVSLSEMHPMTVIEAAQAGLPIVARRDPAIQPGLDAAADRVFAAVNPDAGIETGITGTPDGTVSAGIAGTDGQDEPDWPQGVRPWACIDDEQAAVAARALCGDLSTECWEFARLVSLAYADNGRAAGTLLLAALREALVDRDQAVGECR